MYSDTDKVRIGVLGASWIAPMAVIKPAKTDLLKDVVAITCVAARDIGRAEKFAAKYEIPTVHSTYEDVLNDPNVDAVYIALPNALHCEWTLRSLRAGKHVLVEKPSANNAEQALQMSECAGSKRLVLMEAFHYRYHPMAKRIKEIIDSGDLGQIEHVDVKMCIPVVSGKDIRYNYDLGGGAMMDTGSYCVNFLRYILGEEPEVVSAKSKLAYPNVDQETEAEFSTISGTTGKATCSIFSVIPKISLTVRGSMNSELNAINWVAPHIMYNKLSVRDTNGSNRTEKFDTGSPTTYALQLRAFVEAVQAGSDAGLHTGREDMVKNMEVIDNVYRAAGLPVRGTDVNALDAE
eukprot:TRINITY_DN33358_c0_g1_i1.p1 TRINITY_DN33358_c0_g1~~TRINITY_DN33358_c0_g1_i1.p1  ORF type:complete len:366 (+),score=94.92 TRINITY_DN33358_c0_g1_i1:52-1098(+)